MAATRSRQMHFMARSFSGPILRVALSAAAAVALAIAFGGAPSAAAAASPCGAGGVLSIEGAHLSCRYSAVGEDTFGVPGGLEDASVVAVGAAGGSGEGLPGGAGGMGAVVTAPTVSVAGLTTLYVEVGGKGGDGGGPGSEVCKPGAGGSNGGAAGGPGRCFTAGGGGGGGASDVRLEPQAAGGLTGAPGDPRLVVAGGGGGGGGGVDVGAGPGGSSGGSSTGGAGDGGDFECSHFVAEAGGLGETGAGGGGAGVGENFCFISTPEDGLAGQPGAAGEGGNGNVADSPGGGGGGGGYVGGGGGAAAGREGGGGGGGSSYGPTGSTFATASGAEPAAVTIGWTAAAPSASIVSPADGASYAMGQLVTSSFSCGEGAGGLGISSCTEEGGEASGSTVETATVGAHSFTVTATSADGLEKRVTVTYAVTAPPVLSTPGPTVTPSPTVTVPPPVSTPPTLVAPSTASSPSPVPEITIRLLGRSVKARRAIVTLTCTAADCAGRLSLAWLHPGGAGGARVTTLLSRISYRLAAGASRTFAVPLTGEAQRLLRRAGAAGLEVRVRATTKEGFVVRQFRPLGR
jgi:hypothetical protein